MSRFAGKIARFSTIGLLIGLPLASPPVSAQAPRPAISGRHVLSAEDLERFVDGAVAAQLARLKVPGAVIVVVHGGRILLAKGYGYADVENKRPMTPDTVVRPGSISKLFTGIATMQLVDAGKLDLDRDVNDYLDFNVPIPAGGVPVTLRRLMTHRAGFEEHAKNLFTKDRVPEPLGRWLARSLPRRLFPAGDVPAYSNYGMALAGYVVERAAGQPYAKYVEDRIFGPLRMLHSTFHQPLPDALAPLMAKGYTLPGRPPLDFFETIPAAPAGALSATAADMGRFMLALLGGGSLDDTRILGSESLAGMMTPQFATRSGFMGLTFYGTEIGGLRVVGHDGGTIAFASQLVLSAENGFGMFVSYNGRAGLDAGRDLLLRIIRRYFRVTSSAKPRSADRTDVKPLIGSYQTSRRAESSIVRLSALAAELRIAGGDDANMTVGSAVWPFATKTKLREIGPLLFRAPKDRALAFENKDGRSAALYVGPPVQQWQRVPWHADARFIVPVVAGSLLVVIATLLAWPVVAVVRRFRHRPVAPAAVRPCRAAVRLAFVLEFFVAAATVALFAAAFLDATILGDRLDPALLCLYVAAWLAVFASILAAWRVWELWRAGVVGRWTRAHHTFLAVVALTLAWFLVAFHIAGTTLNY